MSRDLRGTGRTTYQIENAPINSVFVWLNGDLSYPKFLADKLGRQDLKIVAPHWLDHGWCGLELSGLVIDHAAWNVIGENRKNLAVEALSRVRIK